MRRLWRITGWLIPVVALLALFGSVWCGALALRVAQGQLHRSGVTLAGSGLRVGLRSASADAVFLSAAGWSAHLEGGRIDYKPFGLWQRRIDSVFADKVMVCLAGKNEATDDTLHMPLPAQIMANCARAVGEWRIGRIAVPEMTLRQSGRNAWQADGILFGELRGGEAYFAASPWRLSSPNAVEAGGAAHLTLKLENDAESGGAIRSWQAMQARLVVDGQIAYGMATNNGLVTVECRAVWWPAGESSSVTGGVRVAGQLGNQTVSPLLASGTWMADSDKNGTRLAVGLQSELVSGTLGEIAVSDMRIGFSATAARLSRSPQIPWHVTCMVSAPRLATTNGLVTANEVLLSTSLSGTGGKVEDMSLPLLSWRKLDAMGSFWKISGTSGVVTGDMIRVAAKLAMQGSPLQADAVAEIPWRAPQKGRLLVEVPETPLELEEYLARELEEQAAMRLDGGTIEARAEVVMKDNKPSVRGTARLRNLDAHGKAGPDRLPWSVSGAGLALEFAGGVDWTMNAEGRLNARHLAFDRASATNLYARWRATQEELFVERAQAGWCGGEVQAFAVHVNVKKESADMTLFADRVELEEVLGILRAIPGNGQGQLHGRLQVRYRDGELRLGRGYLYSLPGEGGRVQVTDTTMVESALQGIDANVRRQVSTALRDMAFSVFRLDFEPPQRRGEEALLRLKLVGQADRRKDLPPVNLDVNLRGPLNALFNMGMKLGNK